MKHKQKMIFNNIHKMRLEILKLDNSFKSKSIKKNIKNITESLEELANDIKKTYLLEKYETLEKMRLEDENERERETNVELPK